MRTFIIVMKIIFGIFGIIWNCFVKLINMIISAWNKHVRARNDRINRGVTEIKSSTYDSLLPENRSIENAMVSGGMHQTQIIKGILLLSSMRTIQDCRMN